MPFLYRHKKLILSIVAFLAFSVLVFFSFKFSPATLIDTLGARNVYIALFVISLFSAISTFTSTPFYASLVIAITGGLDPIVVALVVAPGVFIGDMVFLYVLSSGVDVLSYHVKWIKNLNKWLRGKSLMMIRWVVYGFFAVVPVSTDLFMLMLVLLGIKGRDVWPYILLGNITFFLLLGYLVEVSSPLINRLILG